VESSEAASGIDWYDHPELKLSSGTFDAKTFLQLFLISG
jgi:hypothetical protein